MRPSRSITNGAHPLTWTALAFAKLYDAHLPGWLYEPELLVRADCCMTDAAIWQAHVEAKAALIATVQERTGMRLNPGHLTLGFARRMTAYQRPDLVFENLERLKRIAGGHCSW